MKKGALGRGLGALLSDSVPQEDANNSPVLEQASINEISVEIIETNPYQPRTDFDATALQELAESIKTQGIIQPITVRRLSENSYQLISGERRLQASKLAGLQTIPAYIRTANDQQMLEMALIENIQRENLNPIEIALSYQRLISECNLKQEELGDRVGKNRTTVTNYLRLLKLPPMLQAALRDKQITMGHARAIINIDNADEQIAILKKIILEDLSVRAVENLVRNLSESKIQQKSEKQKLSLSPEIKSLQTQLSSHFGTKIFIKANVKNQGEIKIPFSSAEDLNRILEIFDL
ncbi:MAG: ParB/RepB/Spo0J family partition protein [Thermonemataceae bacterium]|nr:ParB/RepB/Spo0J family partition protein [Thermonemataceae bacterium]